MQKTAKKVCSLLLAFVLIAAMLPVSALATASGTTQWIGTDLQLGEDLTMRFYANITSEHAADGVMTVTVDGQSYRTFTVSEMTAGDNGYVFPVALGAPQMTAQVKLTLVSGGETVLEKTSSIRDYADAILAGKYTEELKSLVKWMLNYGAAAQGYFGVNTGNPANAGCELESNQIIPEEVPATDVSDKLSGVSFYGVSMVFRSKIALRFYFNVTGSGSYTYTCNGEACETGTNHEMIYVEVPDLNPQAMDTKVQVVVSDGTDSLSVSYSPMDYITRMYRKDSSSDTLKTMLTYAADYFDAAESYVTGEETLVISDSFEAGTYGADADFTIDLSDYSSALAGYSLSGATVNGTAFTSASYADGVVSLDRATVQALEGEQTIALTFTSGSKTLNTSVNVNLYTMLIASAADLAVFPTAMAAKPAGNYVLVNDIDMAGVSFENTCANAFTGTFDGQGHVIYNMATKTAANDWDGGFFGKMFKGTLKNVSFANAIIKGEGAFLAFRNNTGILENVYMLLSFDGMVSGKGWINDTSVLFNDGEGAYLYANNVIVEYAEPLTESSAGYAFYQNLSVSKFNGLYVIGADKISVSALPGSSAAYGCYAKRAAFDADVASWEGDFWTVKNGFPIPKSLIGTAYENGPIYADELTITDTYYVGAQNTGDIVVDLSNYDISGTLTSATVGGTAVTGSFADGILTLSRSGLSFTEGETVAVNVKLEGEGSKLSVDLTLTVCTYTMGTAAELAAFPTVVTSYPAGSFVLVSDIDMAGVSYENTNTAAFTGTFDGQGYVIYNMTTKTTADDWDGGFFGKMFKGTLKNVAFVNAVVKGKGAFLAFRNNSGTLENVYMLVSFDGLVSGGGFTNDSSVLFNDGESAYLYANNVIIEYAETLTASAGYAFYQSVSVSKFNGLYVIGADKISATTLPGSSAAYGCYENRAAFDADVSAWDGNGFWTVVDGFPVPNRLIGVKLPFAISSNAVGYIGQQNTEDTFVLNLSDVKDQLAGASLVDATVDGVSFAVKSYQGGIVTLDKATAGNLSGEKAITLTFESASARFIVSAKIASATYVISTPAQMAAFPVVMASYPAGTYILANDIDMAGVAYANGYTAGNFTGTFDGQGYVIYNMSTKTDVNDWDGGFFGKLYAGTMKNVAFANATVKGQAAFLAFRSIGGKLENVYISFAFDSMVSGTGSFTQDTSVLFNDGNGNYLDATNVVIEYAEPLTNATAGYAVYQSFSQSKINGLYVIGADKVIKNSFSGSNGIYGCYNDRAAFDADVSAWDSTDFWAVVDGFPIPERLVGTIYENGYVEENELNMTASTYVGANNTEKTVTVNFGIQRVETAGMDFVGAAMGGTAFETATYNFNTGVLTLDKATIGTLSDAQSVKLTFTKDGAIYVAYAELIPADMVFYTAAELQTFPALMAANPAGTYALGNNIDFAGYTFENTNTAAFTGVFDGNGYCISNMATKTAYTDWDGGLFGKDFRGTLKNIAFNNAIVKGQGSFLGFRNHGGTMENVYLKVSFDGLVADNNWINDSCVLFNDSEGSYLYANNVIVEYAETPVKGGYVIYKNTSISKFNGLYIIGASAVSAETLPGSSTAYGCYADRSAMAKAVDFGAWYAAGFWLSDANNTPVPSSVFAAAREAANKKQSTVTGTIHQVSVTTNTTRKFIQGGQSDYKIIVDETNAADKKAADIMIKYLARSGVTLPIATADQYTADGKFIVINNDALFAAAGQTMPENLGVAGYRIVTVNDNVFLQSVGVEGIQYAAAAFLKHTLGLEVYGTPESISVVTGSWAWMPDFNITEQPDIETQIMGNWRDTFNPDVQYLMGYTDYADYFLMSSDNNNNGVYDYGTDNHTSMNYLPKNTYYSVTNGNWKWYSGESMWDSIINVPDQLCYTAHGDAAELEEMIQTAADEMMIRINAQPTVIAGQFSVSDTHTACTCSSCMASYNKYGTHAAAVIQFTNRLGAEIQERLQAQADEAGTEKREFTLYLMAYHEYAIAPVTKNADGSYSPIDNSVVCGENVGVLYAPIEAMYTYDLYHEVNSDIAENMEKWATLSDHMYYWLYETGFENYMVPFGSWFTSTENLRHSYNNNADIVMLQGQFNTQNSTGFTTLKVYLNAETGLNVNADYDALVDKFFSKYYGAAGEPMQQYYEELEAWLNDLAIYHPDKFNGWIANEGQNAAEYWPEELLLHWQDLLEEAKTLAAGNNTALNHITDESMFVRYMLITAYGYSDLAADFNADATARNFTHLSSHETLGDL